MEDLVKKLSERQLTNSEVRIISNASVPKTTNKSANLIWVDVAKRLLKSVGEQDNVKLAHNVSIFIEISVKAEVKFCLSATAKINRKRCPHISGLLTYIQCMADTDTQPTQTLSELDAGGLTATLLASVVDLQVTGVRSGDEKKIVAELYTKLTAMFDQSSEKLCDCLLLCRCLIFKKHRKPRVLIPLIRRVLIRGGSSHSSLRCVSGTHYIKLLLLAKMWLFMADTKEVSGVRSLVAGTLKIPEFFKEWVGQNDIPWLRQNDTNPLKVKKILKCMTVSEVLESLYGANKINCEISADIEEETQINVPHVTEEEMEIKDLVTKTKKKKRKLNEEEKLEETQPCNKKSKKTKKAKKTCSLPEKTEESKENSNNEPIQNDNVNKKEKKKRKKKKKNEIKEDDLNSNNEIKDVLLTDVQHNNLVNESTKKKKKKEEKKINGENCTNVNEIVNNEPNENLNGESKKKKKKKNKKKNKNKLDVINLDSTVELSDSTDIVKTDVVELKIIKEKLEVKSTITTEDNENYINEDSLLLVEELSQSKKNEVGSESSKKKKKNRKSDKFTAEDNREFNDSMQILNQRVTKMDEVAGSKSITNEIIQDTEKDKEEIANNVSEDGWIIDTSGSGWNVSPTSQQVKQKVSAEELGVTPVSQSKKGKKEDAKFNKNEEIIDLEDASSSTKLDAVQVRGRNRELMTPTQQRDRSSSKGRRIFTPDSSKKSTPSENKRERKLSGSTPERKTPLSYEEIISHRKRVRRDSLTFTVTDLTEKEMGLLKIKEKGVKLPEKDNGVDKISLGIQTDISSLSESEYDVKVLKPMTEPPNKPEINTDCKVLKPKLDSPGSYKLFKPKTSNQNINEESDSDIEVMEEVFVNNSKTSKEAECNPSDGSDIDEASGTESDIVPCDEGMKMFTDEENRIYHEKLKEKERKIREAEMEKVVQEVLKKDEKEVQERMKKISETEQKSTAPEKTINKIVNKSEVDSNKMLSKLYTNESKTCISKGNEKPLSDTEELEDSDDLDVVLQTIVSDTGRVESVLGLCERSKGTGELEINKENVEPNENDSEVQIVEEKVHSVNPQSLIDAVEVLETEEKSSLKDNTLENKATLINNNSIIDNESELVEDNKTEKEVSSYVPQSNEELESSKLSTEDGCTTQEEVKAGLSDQDEAYEASSDASEEQPRTPTHSIRKKMSDRKRRAALANVQITSDSDMSPVRATQRGMRSAEKLRNRKKENIQNSPVINFGSIEEPMASVPLKINDSSLESIFSSSSIVSTDGSCATVITAPDAATKEMQNGDSDTLDSKNDSSMISEEVCDNSKTDLEGDTTVVPETMHSDTTQEVMEEETNKENVEPLRIDESNISNILESATNRKVIENENTEPILLTKDLVDIDVDEELEVLSTSEVDDDDGEENIPTSPRATRSKNTISAISPQVTSQGFTRRRRLSQNVGKILGETNGKTGSPVLAPQSQRLVAQELNQELIISPDVSDEECELVSPEITEHQEEQEIESGDKSEAEDDITSKGWCGLSSGRIHSPQKMIPEEQDETQPKLTRSRLQQQSKMLDSFSSLSNKVENTLPNAQSRSRSNSLTKGTIPNDKISPKLNGGKPISCRNDNSPLDKRDEEIVEIIQEPNKRGRPRKIVESNKGTQSPSPDLITSPKPGKPRKKVESNNGTQSPSPDLINSPKRGRPRKNVESNNGTQSPSPDLINSPKRGRRMKNVESNNGTQSASPDLFTSPKSRVGALRGPSQSPLSTRSSRQASTSPATSASPSISYANASPKIRSVGKSSPIAATRGSSNTFYCLSPKPSPSTPTRRKSSLTSSSGSPSANSSPSTPRGQKNSLTSPLPSPAASNTSVYSTALSSLASPSPVKETRNISNKNMSLTLKSPVMSASSQSRSVNNNSNLKETEGKQINTQRSINGENQQTSNRERRKSNRSEVKEEEKAGKVNDKSNEEEKEETTSEGSLPKSKDIQTKTEPNKEPVKVSKRKSLSIVEFDNNSKDVQKGEDEDMETDTEVNDIGDAADKTTKRKPAYLKVDSPSLGAITALPLRRSRRKSEVPEIQIGVEDILTRRSSRRSEVTNIKEMEIADDHEKNDLNLLQNDSNIQQESDLNEEIVEKQPRRRTRKSILLEEDSKPVISSPRNRRASLLIGENEEKPNTPRSRRVSLSELDVAQSFSPRRSSRRSIGSGTQSADESNAVQKIGVGQRQLSLAPLQEEVVDQDTSETQKKKTRGSVPTPVLDAKNLQTQGLGRPAATTPAGAKNKISKGATNSPAVAPVETSRSIRPRRSIHSQK